MSTAVGSTAWDVEQRRAEIPILHRQVHGRPLIYLDNAATTQKPASVIDAMSQYYRHANANVHRGVHALSQESTEAFERVRDQVRNHINAAEAAEIIFVRGTTEGINLVAGSYGRTMLGAGDEILLTGMEHHSNIVPWQIVAESTGATLKVVPVTDCGELDMEAMANLLTQRTRIVAVVHVSNALGTINPVDRIVEMAHGVGAVVVVDGAQAMPHRTVDVRGIDCDFYAFSGHKMYGPTGIGVLYGKRALLEAMPPYQSGGDMIRSVSFAGTTYNELPNKFEAGTPNVAGVVGLGATLEYLDQLDMAALDAYEQSLLDHATQRMAQVPGVRVIGTASNKTASLSFVIEGIHPHDVATVLDQHGIAVRSGHHCTQPLMERFGVAATTRASFAFYNTRDEVDALIEGLIEVKKVFS
jgi:cysteine desulfurase/selenocysteine lyase